MTAQRPLHGGYPGTPRLPRSRLGWRPAAPTPAEPAIAYARIQAHFGLTEAQARSIVEGAHGPAEPVPQDTTTEYCWLVELRSVVLTGGPYYHTGFTGLHGQSRSTKDPLKAKRYPTKEAAQLAAFKLDHIAGTWEAIEHGFMPVTPPAEKQAAPQAQQAEIIEAVAKAIYLQWVAAPGYVSWVEGGNAINQDEARRIAREALELFAGQQSERPAPAGEAIKAKLLPNVFDASEMSGRVVSWSLVLDALENTK